MSGMNGFQRIFTAMRIGAAIFLALHAIAHGPGILGAWKIAEIEDASFQPNVLLTGASDTLVAVLGAIWLVAAVAYLVAAYGLLRNARWWPGATLAAALVSLTMTILWAEDAVVGLVVNIAVLAALLGLWAWTMWRGGHAGRMHPGAPSPA
jgi:hypothetical protein